jgi:hypothetical protein
MNDSGAFPPPDDCTYRPLNSACSLRAPAGHYEIILPYTLMNATSELHYPEIYVSQEAQFGYILQ